MALEPIRMTHPADPDRAEVEHRVVRAAERDPERFLAAYVQHEEAHAGRYVCADLMKEVIPEYAASTVSRGRYNNAVHNTAAVLASEQYRRAIGDQSDPWRREARFITGSPGSGKTTLVLANGVPDDTRVVYEGQLLDPSSRAKIGAALDMGLNLHVTAVMPRIEEAFDFTLKRFERVGRGASIGTMARIHDGTPEALAAINAMFGSAVNIAIIDARDRSNPRHYDLKDGLEIWKEELSRGSTEQRLYDRLYYIRREGRGSDDFDRQARGRPIEAGDPRLERQPYSVDQAPRREPGRAGEDRGAGLLGMGLIATGNAAFDGGERVVVMDGSRLHEKRFGGQWIAQKVDPAGMLPKGIYQLDTAAKADPHATAEYRGPIVHVDGGRVYQQHGGKIVAHDKSRFPDPPRIGEQARIDYQDGQALLTNRRPTQSQASATPASDSGSYLGSIVAMDAKTVTQLVDGKRITHELRFLTGKTGELAQGKTLAIDYRGGIGKVTDPQQQSQSRGRTR